MALSQEVRFKISGDTTQLNAAFRQSESLAEASGKRMEKSLKRGVSGKGATRGPSIAEATRQDIRDEAVQRAREKNARRMAGRDEGEVPDGGTKRSVVIAAAASILGVITSIVTRFNEALNTRAKDVEHTTESGLAGLRSTLGTIGGLQAQLEQGRKTIEDIKGRDAIDQAQTQRLSGNAPQAAALPTAMDQLGGSASEKATQAVSNWFKNLFNKAQNPIAKAVDVVSPGALTESMKANQANIAAQAAQHQQNILIERELNRQLAIYEAEKGAIKELNDIQGAGIPTAIELLDIEAKKLDVLKAAEVAYGTAESQRAAQLRIDRNRGQIADASRDANKATKTNNVEVANIYKVNAARKLGLANEVQLNRIELDRLKTLRDIENERGNIASKRAAENAVTKQAGELDASHQRLGQHLLDVNQQLAGQAAEGRQNSRGQTRPLSETERIARRAAQRRERARQGILTGAGGDAGRLIAGAQADEETVGNRLSRASAGVAKKDVGDSTSIKPEIVRSNQLLEAIKNALQPVDVD